MSAFGEREVTELKIFNLKIDDSRHGFIHNPTNSYVSSRAVEGITADDPKSISSQEMTRETYPSEIYIQSLSKANEAEQLPEGRETRSTFIKMQREDDTLKKLWSLAEKQKNSVKIHNGILIHSEYICGENIDQVVLPQWKRKEEIELAEKKRKEKIELDERKRKEEIELDERKRKKERELAERKRKEEMEITERKRRADFEQKMRDIEMEFETQKKLIELEGEGHSTRACLNIEVSTNRGNIGNEVRSNLSSETRLKVEVEDRLKADEEAKAVAEGRKMEEERRMNEIIALEEEMRLKNVRWLVEEQMRHVQEEHETSMKKQKCLPEERCKRRNEQNQLLNGEEEKFSDEDMEVTQAIEKVLVSKGEQVQTRSADQ
ncbi:retrovirus-related Pol polyprotein from transposon opus [Trichonephila clavipes]|nr:retrovirus-related Pol polyprotein from transposon opus [Trichonephila clavipes]